MKISYNNKTKIFIFIYSLSIILLSILLFIPSFWLSQISLFPKNKLLSYILIFFFSIFLCRSVLSYFSMYFGEKIKNIIEKDIRNNILNIFLKQKNNILKKTNHNLLSIKTINLSKNYANAFVNIIEGIFSVLTAFLYSFIYIGIQNIFLFLYCFLVVSIWIVVSIFIRPIFTKNQNIVAQKENQYGNFYFEILKNSFVSSLFFKKNLLIEENENKILKLYSKKKKLLILKSWNSVFTTLMFIVSQIGIILLSYYLMENNMLKNINSINSIIYLSGLFVVPLTRINKLFIDYLELKNSKLIFINLKKDWIFNEIKLEKINIEKIKFKDFSYKIGNNKEIKNINLILNKGDILKIAGSSGSGKSTFISFLTKQNTNFKGEIVVNDFESIENYKYTISYIDQETTLFPMNLEKNLFIDSLENQKVKDIFKILDLEHILERKNLNLNLLSGGEKRRLDWARVFLSNNTLVILDEPFVGIDEKRKLKIIDFLKKWSKDKIIIFISHDNNIQIHSKLIDLDFI